MMMMEKEEKKQEEVEEEERKREDLITIHCELYKASILGLTCSLFHICSHSSVVKNSGTLGDK